MRVDRGHGGCCVPPSEGPAPDAASTADGLDGAGCLVGGEPDVTRDPPPQRGRPTRSVGGGLLQAAGHRQSPDATQLGIQASGKYCLAGLVSFSFLVDLN
jgi:hypothetical protein